MLRWFTNWLKARPAKDSDYRCSCCDENTLRLPPKSFEICGNCFWEDDVDVRGDWNEESGANGISLIQARINYAQGGTCCPEAKAVGNGKD